MIFGYVTLRVILFINFSENFIWENFDLPDDLLPLPRSGHTTCLYNKELYIYGGSIMDFYKQRDDISIFSLGSIRFYKPDRTYNRGNVAWRRNHIGFSIKQYMCIYGGKDDFDNILSDIWILNYNSFKWEELDYKGDKLPAIANHCFCIALPYEKINNKQFELYKSTENKSNNKLEGIFIFGELTQNTNLIMI